VSAFLGLTLFVLGASGAFVAGLLGVGGAVVMIPLLLYVPPLLRIGHLDMQAIAGVTMVQVFVAAMSGMLAHRQARAVRGDLVWVGGLSMAAGSLAGAVASAHASHRFLLLVFALMTTSAIGLVLASAESIPLGHVAKVERFSRPRVAVVSLAVGACAGLVGAGGAFLLVPLLTVVVGVPLRVTIGSSLGITALASTAGLVGKAATGQVPWALAIAVSLGALPGAQLGAYVSRRLPVRALRIALFAVVVVTSAGAWWDLLTHRAAPAPGRPRAGGAEGILGASSWATTPGSSASTAARGSTASSR
jgi:uncharacterized membrane protein YfcA